MQEMQETQVWDPGVIPGLRRFPGEENGTPLYYSCLGNPMDRRAWRGYSPWGHKESDATEHAQHALPGIAVLKCEKLDLGTSVAVQCLGLCSSNAGGTDSVPGWGSRILHVTQPKKKKIPNKQKTTLVFKSALAQSILYKYMWTCSVDLSEFIDKATFHH